MRDRYDLSGALPSIISRDVIRLIWEYLGVVENTDALIGHDIFMYEYNCLRTNWLMEKFKKNVGRHDEPILTFICNVMFTEGIRCADDQFTYILRTFVRYYGSVGVSLLFSLMVHGVHRRGSCQGKSVETRLMIEAINAGMEASGLVASRCDGKYGCICVESRKEAVRQDKERETEESMEENMEPSSKRRRIC